VPSGLYESVPLPQLVADEDVSDLTLDPERTVAILDYLARYHYGSRDHVIWLLAWQTGCRLGGLRALDLRDCDLEGNHHRLSGPAIHFVHRPPKTTLKNAEKGERWNRIPSHAATVIQDYIDGPRDAVLDEEGRAALLTSRHGRVSDTTIRYMFYK
jgi:integrase